MRRRLQSLIPILAALVWATVAVPQPLGQFAVESPILTIDSDQLFEQSEFGQKTFEEFEQKGALLSAENRKIEEELIAEEKELTELRATMDAELFRERADAFDLKVQGIRRAQDRKTRELNNGLDERRVVFLNAAVPILEQLMREAGAAVVLERRSVFIGSNAVDITRIAIDRLNATIGAGDTAPDQ